MSQEYYETAERNPTLAAQWDSYHWLPEPGENLLFDKFCRDKGVSIQDLRNIGTKMTSTGELAWLFPGGIKYRKLTGERRATGTLKQFKLLKVTDAVAWIVAEGETDAAALRRACPNYNIAIMPAGALAVSDDMLAQIADSKIPVLLALDADDAGDAGAAKMPGVRLRPPEPYGDWAEALSVAAVADNFDPMCVVSGPPKQVFSFRELVAADLGTYEENNWLDDGVLPVRGSMIIHGEQKSLKSVVMLELIRSLATGTRFAGYVDYLYDRPARVLLFQFEIPPHAMQLRVEGLVANGVTDMDDYDKLMDNAGVYKIANNEMPRLLASDDAFYDLVVGAAFDFDADIIAFDPFQRMSGASNTNQAHELGPMLDKFHRMATDSGLTVILSHHSSKNLDPRKSTSITGSQRFGADVDSICTLYHDPRLHVRDDNADKVRQRNLLWTLRSGVAEGRGVQTQKGTDHHMIVTFRPPFEGQEPEEEHDDRPDI